MISDDYKKGLGRLCINFQVLEVNILFLTWGLIGEDQIIGRIITSNMSFSRLCSTLVSLSIYRFGKDDAATKTIDGLVKQASQLEQERNKFIHSYWYTDDSSGTVGRLKFSLDRKKGLSESSTDVDAQELHKTADEVTQIGNKFKKFFTTPSIISAIQSFNKSFMIMP